MITFLLMLFGSGGGVAIGSTLKSVTGFFDSISERKELKAQSKLLAKAGDDKSRLALINAIYGDPNGENAKSGNYAMHTRRMLALIAVGTLALVTIHCVLFCYDPFITLPSVATSGESNTWIDTPLITIYRSDKPIQLTLGHLALMDLGSLQMVLGFYFGGRR
jgi:hypothetical protein